MGAEAPGVPGVADGVEHALDPRVIPLQRTSGWISACVLGTLSFLVLAITWVTGGPTVTGLFVRVAGWMAAVAALGWHAHLWPAIEFRHTRYRVDRQCIEIGRGVFWRTVTTVPRSRVQHTDVSQGPLERRWGLGTLVIYTAGTDHARVTLAGLEHSRALRIREHLLPSGESDAV
jgi:uncharacterized protein